MTMLSQLVANIGCIGLLMFLIEQHHIVGGIIFDHDWANLFGHFLMAIPQSFIG